LALQIGHRGYVLETGRMVTSGTADELAADADVRRAYLGF
ncbi:MAG: transporter ATP-binding protein, partial [Acidimicrobiales bacterium]|nr:transporter ATP-binding protein [Acidimicrobiales bacterium]